MCILFFLQMRSYPPQKKRRVGDGKKSNQNWHFESRLRGQNGPFEWVDVFPIEMGGIPASYVSLRKNTSNWCFCHWNPGNVDSHTQFSWFLSKFVYTPCRHPVIFYRGLALRQVFKSPCLTPQVCGCLTIPTRLKVGAPLLIRFRNPKRTTTERMVLKPCK